MRVKMMLMSIKSPETQHSFAMGLDTAVNYCHAGMLAGIPLHEKCFQLKNGYSNLILTSLS